MAFQLNDMQQYQGQRGHGENENGNENQRVAAHGYYLPVVPGMYYSTSHPLPANTNAVAGYERSPPPHLDNGCDSSYTGHHGLPLLPYQQRWEGCEPLQLEEKKKEEEMNYGSGFGRWGPPIALLRLPVSRPGEAWKGVADGDGEWEEELRRPLRPLWERAPAVAVAVESPLERGGFKRWDLDELVPFQPVPLPCERERLYGVPRRLQDCLARCSLDDGELSESFHAESSGSVGAPASLFLSRTSSQWDADGEPSRLQPRLLSHARGRRNRSDSSEEESSQENSEVRALDPVVERMNRMDYRRYGILGRPRIYANELRTDERVQQREGEERRCG